MDGLVLIEIIYQKDIKKNQIENIQDLLSPNGDITESEINNYLNRILSIEGKLKK